MSVEQAWNHLKRKDAEMRQAIEQLKKAIKDEQTQYIQECIQSEEFATATKILENLNNFTKMDYSSNVGEIELALQMVTSKTKVQHSSKPIVVQPIKPDKTNISKRITTKKQPPELEVAVAVETRTLTDKEEQAIQTIGYSGVSRIEDGNRKIEIEIIESLIQKGYLNKGKTKRMLTFEFSDLGTESFKKIVKMEPNPSFIREMECKGENLDHAYLMYDIENVLQEKNFNIEKQEGNHVNVSRDNYFYYLTVDLGTMTTADYLKTLEEKHRLKSIGFICLDDEVLKKAKEAVNEWVTKNKTKCRFMSIHYATIKQLEQSETQNEFEIITL